MRTRADALASPLTRGRRLGAIVDLRLGRRVSPARLAAEVSKRAAVCAALGLGPGGRAALVRGNGWELLADLLAVWEAGACAIVLDPGLPPPALEAALLRGGAGYVLTDRPRPAGAAPSPVWLDPGSETARLPGLLPRARLDDPALILYTSGSSGEPKGVVHSHRTLGARLAALRAEIGPRRLRRTLCVLPSSFGHGLIANCLLPLLSGGELSLLPASSASALADLGGLLDETRATFLSSVPAIWRVALSLSRPPRRGSLERVHCASAPLSAQLWRDARAWTGGADLR
ncbi:MAG: AMP-binding protein, partial [Elusimicrobiota bacterium]